MISLVICGSSGSGLDPPPPTSPPLLFIDMETGAQRKEAAHWVGRQGCGAGTRSGNPRLGSFILRAFTSPRGFLLRLSLALPSLDFRRSGISDVFCLFVLLCFCNYQQSCMPVVCFFVCFVLILMPCGKPESPVTPVSRDVSEEGWIRPHALLAFAFFS